MSPLKMLKEEESLETIVLREITPKGNRILTLYQICQILILSRECGNIQMIELINLIFKKLKLDTQE